MFVSSVALELKMLKLWRRSLTTVRGFHHSSNPLLRAEDTTSTPKERRFSRGRSESSRDQHRGSESFRVQNRGSESSRVQNRGSESFRVQNRGSESFRVQNRGSESFRVQNRGSESFRVQNRGSESFRVQAEGGEYHPLLERGTAAPNRVSSELRKLVEEDHSVDRKWSSRQKPGPDSDSEGFEVLFGVAPCLMALTQGRRTVSRLFVQDGETSRRASIVAVCEEALRRRVQIKRVTRRDLEQMSNGGVHQGVCLQASRLTFLTEDSAPSFKQFPPPLWLVLDRIQDPMNLGAILRSAYFLGVDRVASSIRHSCPLSPVVSKASVGVLEVMGVYGYRDLNGLLRTKASAGWEVVGTSGVGQEHHQDAVMTCSDFTMTKPTLLLMGGEGDGLAPDLLALCHAVLTIPAGRDLVDGIESLNVSVATGILLHTILASRRRP